MSIFPIFLCITIRKLFNRHGLKVFDVEELTTHGGSLRIYACHRNRAKHVGERVKELSAREEKAGLNRPRALSSFGEQVKETKRKFLDFLISAKSRTRNPLSDTARQPKETLYSIIAGLRTESNRLYRRSQPSQTGTFSAGNPHSHLLP